jgi:hypothetical protein
MGGMSFDEPRISHSMLLMLEKRLSNAKLMPSRKVVN